MPLHSDNQLPPHGPEEVDASHGYERSDVRVTGIVVFLTALAMLVAVTGVLCYGIGKIINTAIRSLSSRRSFLRRECRPMTATRT